MHARSTQASFQGRWPSAHYSSLKDELLVDNPPPPAQDECRVTVAGDGLGILGRCELSGDGMTLRCVDRAADEIGAVVLPKVKVRSFGLNRTPAIRGNAFELAVDEHRLSIRVSKIEP